MSENERKEEAAIFCRPLGPTEYLLAEEAIAIEGGDSTTEHVIELVGRLDNPRWDEADAMYDWRNHVAGVVSEVWNNLPLAARLVAYIDAAFSANSEEYE